MEHQWVVYELEGAQFAIPKTLVEAIVKMQPVRPLASSLPSLVGETNYGGQALPVIDLRVHFGLPARQPDGHSRMVVVNLADRLLVLVVDAVTDVMTIRADAVQPASALSRSCDDSFILGLANLDQGLVVLVDLNTAISSADLPPYLPAYA